MKYKLRHVKFSYCRNLLSVNLNAAFKMHPNSGSLIFTFALIFSSEIVLLALGTLRDFNTLKDKISQLI